MLRGSALGSFLGALPGVGPSIASFMSYAIEKRVAKDPSRFGHGAIEGITAPESANNAAAQTAFVPSLSIGIPGDAVMAVMLGALIIHGIQPLSGKRWKLSHWEYQRPSTQTRRMMAAPSRAARALPYSGEW